MFSYSLSFIDHPRKNIKKPYLMTLRTWRNSSAMLLKRKLLYMCLHWSNYLQSVSKINVWRRSKKLSQNLLALVSIRTKKIPPWSIPPWWIPPDQICPNLTPTQTLTLTQVGIHQGDWPGGNFPDTVSMFI